MRRYGATNCPVCGAESGMRHQAMTDEELKIKVAELCGWGKVAWKQPVTNAELWTKGDPANNPHGIRCCVVSNIPDYPNDLNAMHEAIKSLGCELGAYEYWLREIAGDGMCMVEATARQRAMAFVKAKGV